MKVPTEADKQVEVDEQKTNAEKNSKIFGKSLNQRLADGFTTVSSNTADRSTSPTLSEVLTRLPTMRADGW